MVTCLRMFAALGSSSRQSYGWCYSKWSVFISPIPSFSRSGHRPSAL